MSAAVTDWFPADVKPKRKGVYETRLPHIFSRKVFQQWSGTSWGCYAWTPDDAAVSINGNRTSAYQHVLWRGLASDPKASKP